MSDNKNTTPSQPPLTRGGWNKPSPVPENLGKLCVEYVNARGWLTTSYVNATAEGIGDWFFDNYEDPAESTPWDEGDYVYIWGKRYTLEIIQDTLSFVPEELFGKIVEAALKEIEDRGCGDVCVSLFGRHDPEDVGA